MQDRAAELVRYIAQSLVANRDQVQVSTVEKNNTTVIELRVDPEDMGRVIGKQGRIAKAIRTVVKSATSGSKRRYSVDIVE